MKKLVVIVATCVFSSITGFSQELQKSSNGEFRVKQTEVKWQDLGVTITKEAEKYISFTGQAIEKKGDTISVGQTTEKFLGMKSLFYAKIAKKHSQGIVCNGKVVDCVGNYQGKTEVVFAYFIILALISLVLMIISNFLFRKEKFAFAFAVAVAAFAAAAFAAAVVAAAAAVVAAFAAAAAVAAESKKTYRISSIIYYILMLIFFILLFV